MLVRTLAALAVVAAIGNGLSAQQNDMIAKVGDELVIVMSGDLAREYARCTGPLREDEALVGLQIETIATVVQELNDGRIRIEHSAHVGHDRDRARLVTLTAVVDPSRITSRVTPKGTPVYASPGAKQSTLTTNESKTLRLGLSDLKGIKLRTWVLAEEIGE